jgi:putative ABC transport system permease protein
MKDSAATFWPGIMLSKATLLKLYPDSKGQTFFLALQPGTDAKVFANHVEATLVQASAESLTKVIDDNEAISRGFLNMFQGFLALGLLVGIAALGVISFRAVVERRQQIGMLRAIGYQRSMVQLSVLLESGFIAASGIILGIGLGLTFAWSLFTSGEFGETSKGIAFTVPWLQLVAVVAFAFIASLLMTYLPARSASKIAVAEALRYE